MKNRKIQQRNTKLRANESRNICNRSSETITGESRPEKRIERNLSFAALQKNTKGTFSRSIGWASQLYQSAGEKYHFCVFHVIAALLHNWRISHFAFSIQRPELMSF